MTRKDYRVIWFDGGQRRAWNTGNKREAISFARKLVMLEPDRGPSLVHIDQGYQTVAKVGLVYNLRRNSYRAVTEEVAS